MIFYLPVIDAIAGYDIESIQIAIGIFFVITRVVTLNVVRDVTKDD